MCYNFNCKEKATTKVELEAELERELNSGAVASMVTKFCRKCFVKIAKDNVWNVVMHTSLEES